jgi:hypothetical protein
MLIAPPATFWLTSVTVGALTAIIVKTTGNATPHNKRLNGVKSDWDALRSAWRTQPSRFDQIRRDLDAVKARHDALSSVRAQRLQQLSDHKRQKQLQDHLELFSIASAKISGIGPAKVAMLGSYGIDTAGDIIAAKVIAVPGFGEVTTRKLIVWRQQLETRFRFDPNRAISPADIVAVQRDVDVQGAKLQQELASGLANLKAIIAAATAHRQALEGKAAELMPRYTQAAADAAVMPVSPNAHKGLIALASAAICVNLLSLVSNSGPRPGSTQVQVAVPQSPPTAAPVPHPPVPQPTPTPSPPAMPAEQADIVAPALLPVLPIPMLQAPFRAPVTSPAGQHVQTRQAVNMRSAPDNTSTVVRIVPQGAVMTVYARRDGWVQVGEDAPQGWIYSSLLANAP